MADKGQMNRVLMNLTHGGHALIEEQYKENPNADALESVSALAEVTGYTEPDDIAQISTPFDYMLPGLRDLYPDAHLPLDQAAVVPGLKALGSAMVEAAPPAAGPDSSIPPVYTYWGQFVDHDLTANTDRENLGIEGDVLEPIAPRDVVRYLRNLREPALNLDSLYGNGPDQSGKPDQVLYEADKTRFKLGELFELPNGQFARVVPGIDLPRQDKKPLIGDGRNDENLIVAQLHGAMLTFHNKVVAWLEGGGQTNVPGATTFERAKRLVQWHYQWICLHDFVARLCRVGIVDELLDGRITPVFTPKAGESFMPLEFSVAAFRFGHSMVRGAYDHNENFGAPGGPAPREPRASFDQLFQFTGGGGFLGDEFPDVKTLPDNWPIRWERFTGAEDSSDVRGVPPRLARKIDTHLAPPLANLRNEGNRPEVPLRVKRILKRLAVRNLMRGYRLGIPTGQAVAVELGVAPLTTAELLSGDIGVSDALMDGGFVNRTPLWFYVLKEAEVRGQGERLGEVGSRIVAETIIGQLKADTDSILGAGKDWRPADGVRVDENGTSVGVDTVLRLLRFAGLHP